MLNRRQNYTPPVTGVTASQPLIRPPPRTAEEFVQALQFEGTELRVTLSGPENFPEWNNDIRRKAKKLGVIAIIDQGQSPDDRVVEDLLKTINVTTMADIMISSLASPLNEEMRGKSASEIFTILSARYRYLTYTTRGVELCQLRQATEEPIRSYVSNFNDLKHKYIAAGGTMTDEIEVSMFIAGMTSFYKNQALGKLQRQGSNGLKVETLKQVLVSEAARERDQQNIPKAPTSQPGGPVKLTSQPGGLVQPTSKTKLPVQSTWANPNAPRVYLNRSTARAATG